MDNFPFHFILFIGTIVSSIHSMQQRNIYSFDDLNVTWLMVNNYTCNRMFIKHVMKQKVSNFPLKLI